ncbi:MAG: tetratricopeptide repeat protein, partial [Gammaproteobacteria bacterium]|nr:tetratricopeptide repeat protein [Gammaproteobacteria bacterium]
MAYYLHQEFKQINENIMNVIKILNLLSLMFLLVACSSVDREKAEYFEQAKQMYQAGEYEKAGDIYRKILELDPDELRARFHLAQTLEKLQDFNGAASQYNAILEQDETHVRSRIRLGQFLLLAGNYDQAMEYAETAMKHAPDNADVLAFRGSVFLKQNNPESAMRD